MKRGWFSHQLQLNITSTLAKHEFSLDILIRDKIQTKIYQ